VVIGGELWVLDTLDLLTEGLNERRGSGLTSISVVGGLKTSVDEHDRGHILDAVIAIGKVIHGLELFVDNSNAGFVGAAGNFLDIGGGFTHILKLVVNGLCGFDGGLGVEFGCRD